MWLSWLLFPSGRPLSRWACACTLHAVVPSMRGTQFGKCRRAVRISESIYLRGVRSHRGDELALALDGEALVALAVWVGGARVAA